MNTYNSHRYSLAAMLLAAVEGGLDVTTAPEWRRTTKWRPKRRPKASQIERKRATKKRAAKQARKRQRKAK